MRDLNPLIKTSSSHRVVTGDDSEMFVNVCRDIPPGVYHILSLQDKAKQNIPSENLYNARIFLHKISTFIHNVCLHKSV